MSYAKAMEKGFIRDGPPPTKEELKEIEKSLIEPQMKLYELRSPEKYAKTEHDYMRLSYKEEDEAYLAE